VLCDTKIDGKIRGEKLMNTVFQNACFWGGEKLTGYKVPYADTTKILKRILHLLTGRSMYFTARIWC
jgi:hypothetical protein